MRVPDWTKTYWIESRTPVMRTSRPVSSATSRRAVSSVDSPRFGVPLGRVQARPSRSRRRLPTTSWGRPSSCRTTMPPADVAVAFLSRATAPYRRARCAPVRVHPTASSASARPGADDHSWPTAGRAVGCASRRAVGTPPGRPSAAAPSCGRSPGRRSRSRPESQPALAGTAGRANESRRRPGRVLGGDGVSHGPQW